MRHPPVFVIRESGEKAKKKKKKMRIRSSH